MGLFVKSIILFSTILVFNSCEVIVATVSNERPTINKVDETTASISGVLGKRFYKKLVKFAEENPSVKNLILQNIPGSMNDEWNVKSCAFLHENCYNTILNDSSIIASGGVDLFISGNNRTVNPKAQIGVHSWRDMKKDGIDYPRDSEEHQLFIDFFNKIEMDTAFYWYTLRAAPGDSIHWMTAEEIKTYGLPNAIDSTHQCSKDK